MAAAVATDSDLINFDIIESHKENIQSLPSGRSAKQLASVLSPLPSGRPGGADTAPTLEETKTLNDAIRQEYEIELQSIAESDDPLDIYDRYVRWTLNSYPSAQATPQSQLLPLLERATKAFLTSSHYKNDPRYLKLWLHYIRLFSDTPRETFAFLARHGIGEGLGLFYEEFAAWLEGAGRWMQADEVYKLGIEREARPTERLVRKYNHFQQRFDARAQNDNEPSSPALPTVRPALAAKIDPFASAHTSEDPQAAQQRRAAAPSRSGKPKMAIFSDSTHIQQPPPTAGGAKGWDSIGSVKERKKENTIEARPWAGEKLKAGGKVGAVPKMEVFKDPAFAVPAEQCKHSSSRLEMKQASQVVNPRTGRAERVFVNLEAVYPPDSDLEFSFEELRAMSRGWALKAPRPQKDLSPLKPATGNPVAKSRSKVTKSHEPDDIENLTHSFQQKADLNKEPDSSFNVCDVSTQSMVGMPEAGPRESSQPVKKERRLKVREVKQETQTVKTRLDSPSGRKLKRKHNPAAEPTMTFHSKAATNEIYDMFNQPLRKPTVAKDDTQSGEDTEFADDDGYSTAGESTGTGRVSAPSSEFGDDTLASIRRGQSQSGSQSESVSSWSEFSVSKDMPRLAKDKASSTRTVRRHKQEDPSEEMTENVDSSSQNPTQTSGLMSGFDTQAIAAIADGDFDELDTKAIALMAGDVDADADVPVEGVDDEAATAAVDEVGNDKAVTAGTNEGAGKTGPPRVARTHNDESLVTPTDNDFPEQVEIQHKPCFIPLPPVDYEPTPARPYRDPALMAQNKLPFMTPIAERTESSLAPSTAFSAPGYFDAKTPSRSKYDSPSKLGVADLLLSSPQQQASTPTSASPAKRKHGEVGATEDEVTTSSPHKKPVSKSTELEAPLALSNIDTDAVFKAPAPLSTTQATTRPPLTNIRKGPIIPDLQCNPCDDAVRQQILTAVYPPLSTQKGFYDHSTTTSGRYNTLKSFAEKQMKAKTKASPRKSQSEKTLTKAVPPVLKFEGTTRIFAVKRELGEGAFAPVYLVDSYDPGESQELDENDKENKSPPTFDGIASGRENLEAVKTECPPGTLVWEFHILRTVKQRLGSAARIMQSIVLAHECHLYRDEAFIILQYSPQGTLLDLINAARIDNTKGGKPAEGVDEVVAMWLAVELLRVLEDLHRVGILHGDLKGDNCLVRFDTSADLTAPYCPEGNHGWNSRGIKLIDFGRGIDTRMFKPNAQFIADWDSCPQDCAEIRECRPWKWQIDYHGVAGIMHSLLFGKYMDTVPVPGSSLGPGQKKAWKLKESFKRYWEKDVWGDVFATLLNPGCVADGEEMPIQKNLGRVRARMEKWLVDEGERGGRDLRGSLRKMERLVCK
ncbi:BUB protein kinase [Cladophialophora yegresii CBS 114405]|uniref:BUB protein kinase n=1 Tax=Cladophialophora yegresii CBS 114405 TaxID=1182544 RepID=W9WJD3_9EURO|nr:BUB protein kinase [Cladophialophora yegresii CBS 114405]EXJ64731.1 BUB protein kinase [Cladophialophora yegresii CBS 114405]